MADKAFNDDDLLLFDVMALINAYEEGMFKEVRKGHPSEEIILTGYQHPLSGMETTLELSLLSADSSMEEIVNGIVLEQQRYAQYEGGGEPPATEKESIKNVRTKKEKEEIDYFYSECSFTDAKGEPTDEWWDPQNAVVRKNLNFLADENDSQGPVGYEYKKRFTNEYNRKFGAKVTKYLEDHAPTVDIGDKTYKLSLEECLNCMIDINVSLTLPSLEFVFNLDKILREIERLLKEMLDAMDPSVLYDAICQFLANFGPNFACPANLIGINLILPTLFAKYSIDLAKVRFDWTGLFGPMIKSLLDFLIQAVESIPKMINPFIDCIINALTTIMNAIRAIVASAEKITNETISAVNNVGYAIQKLTPNSWFDPVSVDLKQDYEALKRDLNERVKQEGKDHAAFKNSKLQDEKEDFSKWLLEVSKGREIPVSKEWAKDLLQIYLKDPDNSDLKHYLEYELERSANRASKELKSLDASYKAKIAAAEKKEKLENDKDFFNFDLVADTKTITTPYFKKADKPDKRINFDIAAKDKAGPTPIVGPIVARDASIKKSDWSAVDYALAKYGVDIKNEYRQPKDLIDYRAKGWVRKLNESEPFQFIEKTIIGSLLTAKKWLNEQVAKVVQTLKALQAFMGDVIQSEFKLLGEMQWLAHLIRFIRLIMKFFDEGLSCENLKKNKRMVEDMIARNNSNVSIENSSQPLMKRDIELSPDEYIKVKHKLTNNVTIIDLNECSDLDSMLKVKKDNLDSIYEGILNGLQT